MTDDAGDLTPAQKRAQQLGEEMLTYLSEPAENAPPLTEEQRDVIRVAFRAASTPRRAAKPLTSCYERHRPRGGLG
jgi:hypothetical protein